jgi:hypothetical protein
MLLTLMMQLQQIKHFEFEQFCVHLEMVFMLKMVHPFAALAKKMLTKKDFS